MLRWRVAFRSEKDASRHRIDALEDELEEKDAELERLRAEVERRDAAAKDGARKTKKRRSKRRGASGERAEAPPQGVPTGTTWSVREYSPLWMLPVAGCGLGVCLAALGLGSQPGQSTAGWLVMLLPLALVALALDKRVVLDRGGAGVSKRWGPLRMPLDGSAFRVAETVTSSENGPNVYWGSVYFGEDRLVNRRKAEAIEVAQKMAAFMGRPYKGSKFSQKDQERGALGALVGTFGLVAFLGFVLALAYLVGLYQP